MKGFTLAALGLAGVALSGSALASGIGGDAGGYNVFIFGTGNFDSENTDTMGNLAAGGNVSLMNYTVAAGIAGNSAMSPNPARLVVGGTLTAQNGGVGSNQQGAIYTNNPTSLTSFTARGGVLGQTLIGSFTADATTYTNLSTSLSTLAANGTASPLGPGNTLTLTGTSSGLNVIDLAGSTLTNSQTININAPTGSTVLINVSGTSATFQNGQVFETGATAATVLYNFYQATSVDLSTKDPEGSILAPDAGVVGANGQMHGQLVAGSYGGSSINDGVDTTQFDNVVFTGNLNPVPVPAPAWLLLSALLGLGLFMRPGAFLQSIHVNRRAHRPAPSAASVPGINLSQKDHVGVFGQRLAICFSVF
jgi:choice-of-anchor A domain-containing protein